MSLGTKMEMIMGYMLSIIHLISRQSSLNFKSMQKSMETRNMLMLLPYQMVGMLQSGKMKKLTRMDWVLLLKFTIQTQLYVFRHSQSTLSRKTLIKKTPRSLGLKTAIFLLLGKDKMMTQTFSCKDLIQMELLLEAKSHSMTILLMIKKVLHSQFQKMIDWL